MTSFSTSIFVLNALNLELCRENGSVLRQGLSLYFSNLMEAEQVIKDYRNAYRFFYEEETSSLELYCLLLDEYQMDCVYPKKLSTRVYSPDGFLKDRMRVCEEGEDYGESPVMSGFLPGDLVEAPIGEYLQTAIVVFAPSAPDYDYYQLIVYPSMETEYVYAPLVFPPSRPLSNLLCHQLTAALKTYQKEQQE